MQDGYMDLLELQETVSAAVSGAFPEAVWVRAEISSLSVKSNGHCYLELSQSDGFSIVAKARAAIWRSKYTPIAHGFRDATGVALAAGMEILAHAKVSYSAVWGFLLSIDDIDASFTLGKAEQNRRETIARLEKEGLLDMQKELCLPLLPYRLAVISSATAAGLEDFLNHLTHNPYGFRFDVRLVEALMQGTAAPESIMEALSLAESSAVPFDAVLILRGGGSDLDLACFDDYDLAAAIARCQIPVLTAIGHEKDYHVADMTAHTFVKTPTALADLLLDCYISEDQHIAALEASLKSAFAARLSNMSLQLQAAFTAFRTAVIGRLANEDARLGLLELKVASCDPAAILSKGYAVVTDSTGVKMRSAAEIRAGDRISVLLSDATLRCTVDSLDSLFQASNSSL